MPGVLTKGCSRSFREVNSWHDILAYVGDIVATTPIKPKCNFKLTLGPEFRCPHDEYSNGLCIFHLLSLGERLPDHAGWRLSVSIPTYGNQIRAKFSELLQFMESDPSRPVADFRGFRLPEIDLRGHTFTKGVLFSEARFYGSAIFSEATFQRPVDFDHAVFAGSADFYSMAFEDAVSFALVRFEDDADFVDGVCQGPADFNQCSVAGRLHFLNWEFEQECSFWSLRRSKGGAILFDLVNLDKATFLGTQLESVEFQAVRWLSSGKRRNMLYDELPGSPRGAGGRRADPEHPLSEAELGYHQDQLAANYRQLVLNYERTRDFDTAEDFHFGEMEMRNIIAGRRLRYASLRWLWRHVGPYKLYRVFSGYGASWARALCWLLVWSLLVFPSAFMVAGFQRVDPVGGKSVRVIQYRLAPDPRNIRQWLLDYGQAISLSLSAATFQRVRLYEPAGPWSYFLMISGSVIFTSQAALLLLALRRQFKR